MLTCWFIVSSLFMGHVAGVPQGFKIHQRGVQWKQGVVVYIIL